jgi:hypothetical protein
MDEEVRRDYEKGFREDVMARLRRLDAAVSSNFHLCKSAPFNSLSLVFLIAAYDVLKAHEHLAKWKSLR